MAAARTSFHGHINRLLAHYLLIACHDLILVSFPFSFIVRYSLFHRHGQAALTVVLVFALRKDEQTEIPGKQGWSLGKINSLRKHNTDPSFPTASTFFANNLPSPFTPISLKALKK
jgi:hypothetical protein